MNRPHPPAPSPKRGEGGQDLAFKVPLPLWATVYTQVESRVDPEEKEVEMENNPIVLHSKKQKRAVFGDRRLEKRGQLCTKQSAQTSQS
jgi:hypothetical protein